jgi:hypothetical protein
VLCVGSCARLCFCVTVVLLINASSALAEDYLSIKFSQKNQLRTGLVWLQHKSELVFSSKVKKRTRRPRSLVNIVEAEKLDGTLPYIGDWQVAFY